MNDDDVADVVHDEVLAGRRRCFFVIDADRLRGVLTLGDVKAIPRERWGQTPVQQVMTPVAKRTSPSSQSWRTAR